VLDIWANDAQWLCRACVTGEERPKAKRRPKKARPGGLMSAIQQLARAIGEQPDADHVPDDEPVTNPNKLCRYCGAPYLGAGVYECGTNSGAGPDDRSCECMARTDAACARQR